MGLLNEGMRFRDLETGVFLTRDPIGYADGPNLYCYVHCNPITHFDALGLEDESATEDNSLTAAVTQDGTLSAIDALTNPEPIPSFVPEPETPQYGPTIAAAEAQPSQQDGGSVSSAASDTPGKNKAALKEAGVGTPTQQKDQKTDPDVYLNPVVKPPPPGSPTQKAVDRLMKQKKRDEALNNPDEATPYQYPKTNGEKLTDIGTFVTSSGALMAGQGTVLDLYNVIDSGDAIIQGVREEVQHSIDLTGSVYVFGRPFPVRKE